MRMWAASEREGLSRDRPRGERIWPRVKYAHERRGGEQLLRRIEGKAGPVDVWRAVGGLTSGT